MQPNSLYLTAARALDAALKKHDPDASAALWSPKSVCEHGRDVSQYYVVASRGGGQPFFAYGVTAVDAAEVSRDDWDHDAWHASQGPVDDLALAVHFYRHTGHRLYGAEGAPLLNDDQVRVLDLAKGGAE
jgi:hypothetical protein